ncbi:MAG: tetratricopeptide repeat protein [Alphaproteobacteria bacterium]
MRRSASLCAALLFLFAALVATPLSAAGGEAAVTIRAGYHDGFARVVFDWPKPVAFDAREDGRVVTIQFKQKLRAPLSTIERRLPGLVTAASLADDGRTVRLEVERPVELRVLSYGKRAVVDLFERRTLAAEAASQPETLNEIAPGAGADASEASKATEAGTPPATAGAAVDVRLKPFLAIVTRDYGGFGRLFFDWDRIVNYTVKRDGHDLVIRFDVPAIVAPPPEGQAMPAQFLAIEPSVEADATVVRVRTRNDDAKLRHFQRGHRIIVDLMDPKPDDQAGGRPEWAAQETVPLASVEHEALKKPARTDAASETIPSPAPARPAEAAAPPSLPEPPVAPLPSLDAPRADLMGKEETPAPAAPSSLPQAQDDEPDAPAPGIGEKALAKVEAMMTPRPAQAPVGEGPAEQIKPAALPVRAEAIGDGVRIGFPFAEETGAAVFDRMGFLWIVFATKRELDLAGLDPDGPLGRIFVGAEQLDSADATVLRLALAPQIGAQVVRTGNTWSVELMQGAPRPVHAVAVRIEPGANDDGPARVVLPIAGARSPVRLTDPEVGDTIIAVPSTSPSVGIAAERSFVQFKVLVSAQGAAVVPAGDAIRLAKVEAGVALTADRPLAISAHAAAPRESWAEVEEAEAFDEPILFDYARWRRDDLGSLNRARQQLQIAAADASGAARSERRLDLARLLFAYGLATDALGVLERIAAEDEGAARQPGFLALRGAAHLLGGRYDEAARDLHERALDGYQDALLWRAALAEVEGDVERANAAFAASGVAMAALPPDFRRRFELLAAQAALAVQDHRQAAKYLDTLKASAPKPAEAAEIAYLEARLHQESGKTEAALAAYDKLASRRDGPVGVRAALAAIEIRLASGELGTDAAIEALERLRTAWRGDAYENQVLRRLAALYADKRDYMNALASLRDAVERFPDAPGSAQLREQMFAMMNDLFVEGDAEKLSPLEALGLYYEFEDSAPGGAARGRIVEGLANKLIAIDLLDRAAVLLEKQVAKLDGNDRARLALRLAEVKLLDGKPEAALDVIRDSASAEMAAPLLQERQRLAARADAALGQPGKGIQRIAGDDSREAAELRVELYWDERNWRAVAAAVERLYPADGTDLAALKPEDHARLMRGAVARALSKDKAGLEAMRAHFGATMKETDYAGAFDFITHTIEPDGVDMRELPKLLANLEGIEAIAGGAAAKQ